MTLRPPLCATIACAVALVVFGPPAATAQVQLVRLERAAASVDEAFSAIRGVRELRDGRVLVSDYIEQRVAVVDFATGAMRDVLTEGAGPANVRLPMYIVPALADSSFVIDWGNNRLVVMSPEGRPARLTVVEQPGRLFLRGVDASGAWLHSIPGWVEGPNALPDDSVRIVRSMPGASTSSTVTVVQGTRMRKDRGPSQEPRIPTVGFASQDAWVITASGEIAIVRANPYRVDFLERSGRIRSGPAQPLTTRPVTVADKRRFVRAFALASPVSGRGPGGGMGRGPEPTARELARYVETTEWAETHPPFDAGGVHAAPDGRIWVRQSSDPERPARYDVFDSTGARVQQVELPLTRSVAHISARWVYAIRENEEGVHSLERYAKP
jgi:hypothetical protein